MLAHASTLRGTHAAVGTHRKRLLAVDVACGSGRGANRAQKHYTVSSLFREARRSPLVELPLQSHAEAPQPVDKEAQAAEQIKQNEDDSIHALLPTAACAQAIVDSVYITPHCPTQQQVPYMPNRKVRPSRMDFDTMYQQLHEWRQMHLSAHVPRYCFDAPELGAWVRKMRKLYNEKQLEQWKIERLNKLGFEWELTDQDARWHHLYHQLRRYQLLHGTTDVNTSYSDEDGCDWTQVAWWLQKQARLLAKQKLSGHKRDMLAHLGVTLRIPKRIITRTAQLQAMNGPERRKLRKKWKKLDMEAADKVREQREQQQQQRQEQLRLQQEVASRRLALLREAAGLSGIDYLFGDSSTRSSSGGGDGVDSSNDDIQQLVDHQLQQFQQLSGSLQQQRLQQQPRTEQPGCDVQVTAGKPGRRLGNVHQRSSSSSSSRPPDASAGSSAAAVLPEQHNTQRQVPAPGPNNSDARDASTQPGDADTSLVEQQQQQQQQQQQSQQQQQQQGLLYGRNRRNKRVHTTTKQERWMSGDAYG